MKPKRMIFVLVAIAAVALAITPTLVKASASEATVGQPPVAEPAPAGLSQDPAPANIAPPERGCRVSRTCAYPPPSSISCSSTFYECSEGSDGYGWVECDGVRTYCSGPSCSGTGTPCIKQSDCYTPGVCTCGEGSCSNGYCVCPVGPPPQ